MDPSPTILGHLKPKKPEFRLEDPIRKSFVLNAKPTHVVPQRKKRRTSKGSAQPHQSQRKKAVRIVPQSSNAERHALSCERSQPPQVERVEVDASHAPHMQQEVGAEGGGADVMELAGDIDACMDMPGVVPAIPRNEDLYLKYEDAVFSDEDMIIRISKEVFVVLGWTTEVTSTYYHLARIRAGNRIKVTCLCPTARKTDECFHAKFMKDWGEDIVWPMDDDAEDGGATNVCLFVAGEGVARDTVECIFSVPSVHDTSIKNRAIVTYTGLDTGEGIWKCLKDPTSDKCAHTRRARRVLRLWKNVEDDSDGEDATIQTTNTAQARGRIGSAASQPAISHLPRALPVWAQLKHERGSVKAKPLRSPPDVIRLDEDSSCDCSSPRVKYIDTGPTEIKTCTIFTLSEAWTDCKVELQRCGRCKRKFVGPDGKALGLFNWNNTVMFTEELLDEYTSQYTTSETPFSAFVLAVSRRYTAAQSPVNFVSAKMFRGVWFAYSALLRLEKDMECPKCGENPTAIIVDGVEKAAIALHVYFADSA